MMSGISLIAVSGLFYLLAMVFYIIFLVFKRKFLGYAATSLCATGVAVHLIAFFLRWKNFYDVSGSSVLKSVPITNLYESLQFFALLLVVAYLVFEFVSKNRVAGAFAAAVAGATVLFIDAIGASSAIAPLVPALQSNWLLAHVSLSFIAYVFFALSAITAFLYLIISSERRREPAYIFWTFLAGAAASALFALIFDAVIVAFDGDMEHYRLFAATLRNGASAVRLMFLVFSALLIVFFWYYGTHIGNIFRSFKLNLATLDMLTYKFAVLGFIIFTVGGLIFGAIWAEQAWGRYWSWDPKETWAFITWVVYGVYLHGRTYGGWRAKLSNSLAVVGFILTIFTYLGVNLLLSGLHSYGGL